MILHRFITYIYYNLSATVYHFGAKITNLVMHMRPTWWFKYAI